MAGTARTRGPIAGPVDFGDLKSIFWDHFGYAPQAPNRSSLFLLGVT